MSHYIVETLLVLANVVCLFYLIKGTIEIAIDFKKIMEIKRKKNAKI